MKILGIRRPFIVMLCIAVAIAIVAMLLVDVAPPSSATVTHMRVIASRVLEFAQANNRLPSRLSELPRREGFKDDTRDGWGREIIYEVKPDGQVVLTSYGKDGQPGGQGANTDRIVAFRPRNESGGWNSEVVWTYESWQPKYATAPRP